MMSQGDNTSDCKGVQERVRFFTGQLLGADDFAAEQEYVLERMRTKNRMTRGWGVVCGLSVAPAGGQSKPNQPVDPVVTVGPGYALSPRGDEIILEESTTVDVAAALGTLDGAPATVFVAVRYAECLVRPVVASQGGGSGKEFEFSRIRSSHELSILHALPQSHVQFASTQLAWQTTWNEWVAQNAPETASQQPLPVPPCPPLPVDSWVVLAGVRVINSANGARIEAVDFAPRRVLWPSWAVQTALAAGGMGS